MSEALILGAVGIFQRATSSAAARANSIVSKLVRSIDAARSARRAALLSSGLTLAAAAVVVFVLGKADMLPHGPGPASTATAAGTGNPEAEQARVQAFRAYVRGSWQECLDDLDIAKRSIPTAKKTQRS